MVFAFGTERQDRSREGIAVLEGNGRGVQSVFGEKWPIVEIAAGINKPAADFLSVAQETGQNGLAPKQLAAHLRLVEKLFGIPVVSGMPVAVVGDPPALVAQPADLLPCQERVVLAADDKRVDGHAGDERLCMAAGYSRRGVGVAKLFQHRRGKVPGETPAIVKLEPVGPSLAELHRLHGHCPDGRGELRAFPPPCGFATNAADRARGGKAGHPEGHGFHRLIPSGARPVCPGTGG